MSILMPPILELSRLYAQDPKAPPINDATPDPIIKEKKVKRILGSLLISSRKATKLISSIISKNITKQTSAIAVIAIEMIPNERAKGQILISLISYMLRY